MATRGSGANPFGRFCGHFLIAGALIHTQLDVQRLSSGVPSSEPPPLQGLELPGLLVPHQDSRVLLGPASASPPGAAAGGSWAVPDSPYFPLPRDRCLFWCLLPRVLHLPPLVFQAEGAVWSPSICPGWKRTFPTSLPAPWTLSYLTSGCQYNSDCQGFFEGTCVKCCDFASTTLAGPHKHVRLLNLVSLWQAREGGPGLCWSGSQAGVLRPCASCDSRSLASGAPLPKCSVYAGFIGHACVPASLQPHDFPVRQWDDHPAGKQPGGMSVARTIRPAFPTRARTDTEVRTGCGTREGGAQPSAGRQSL